MSEPTWTTMHIGGTLPAGQIEELLDVVEEDFHDLQDGPADERKLRATANANESLCLQGMVNYGNPEAVLTFCVSHSLTFWLHFDAGREWDAGIQIWKPGADRVEERVASSQSCEPMISLDWLRGMKDNVHTIKDVVDDLARFESDKVPAFAIGAVNVGGGQCSDMK